jgi:hypothetical protein
MPILGIYASSRAKTAANTYEAIATVTVGSGGTASIEFTSIPGTYTDLLLRTCTRGTTTNAGYIYLNTSSSNFSWKGLYWDGVNVFGDSRSDNYGDALMNNSADTASTFSNSDHYFPNYAGNTNKSFSQDVVTENNGTYAQSRARAWLWSNTSAITGIKITAYSGNFAQYSTATLYGIKNS